MLYKVKVTPLTNIHVGTGNELSQYDFIVLGYEDNKYFVRFDFFKFMKSLSRDKLNWFMKLLEWNNVEELKRFVERNIMDKAVLYKVRLNRNFDLSKKIYELPRNPFTQEPYIPGSSIKGAIRTSIMYYLNKKFYENKSFIHDVKRGRDYEAIIADYGFVKEKRFYDRRQKREVEKKIVVQNIERDPFRLISLSDAIFPVGSETINKALYFHKFKKKEETKEVYLETIKGCFIENKEFQTEINFAVNDNFLKLEGKYIPRFCFNLNEITKMCNTFYYQKFIEKKALYKNVLRGFYKEEIFEKIESRFKEILKFNESDASIKKCIVRLGRFSQIENYLLKNDNVERKTRRIDNSGYPFGFLELSFREF